MKALIVHASIAQGYYSNLCDGSCDGHAKYLNDQRLSCGDGDSGPSMCKKAHRKVTCVKCLKLLKKEE